MGGTDGDAREGVADQLIASLAGEGDFVGDSAFRLDPSKAREKLRAYQLQDPHAYVLLLVEAARVAGDSSIDLSCGETTQATFEGLSLSRSELEYVFDAVFSDAGSLRGPAHAPARLQRLLGIAANAAIALNPRALIIENVDAQGVLNRLTIAPDGATRCEAVGPGPAARTRFVFEGQRDDTRDDREVALLRERCRMTEMVVNLYGQRVSEGSRTALLGLKTRRIKLRGETIGRAGLGQDRADAGVVHILTRGVLSETLPFAGSQRQFMAIVDTDLRKDLSQSTVIRDQAFAEVMAAVDVAHAELARRRA